MARPLFVLLVLISLISACRKDDSSSADQTPDAGIVDTKEPEKEPELVLGLQAEIEQLTPTFPHGLTLNDRVSTVANTENYRKTALAPDGSLFVLSDIKHSDSASNYVQYGYVSRINSDGTKDASFASTGILKIHSYFGDKELYINQFWDNGNLMIIGHNWYVAGQIFYSTSVKIDTVAGARDWSYANATNGFARKNITNRTYGVKIAKASDGNFLHLVATNQNSPHNMHLYKTDSAGALVTSWGTSGVVSIGSAQYFDYWKMILDSSGNIYIGYLEGSTSVYQIAIKKILPDGTLDTTFGDNGYFRMTAGTSSYFTADLQLKDNVLIAPVSFNNSNVWSGRIIRVNAQTGALLTENGSVDLKLPDGEVCDVGDIKIYKTKLLAFCSLVTTSRTGIVAFNEDMSLDKNFGTEGILLTTGSGFTIYETLLDESRKTLWLTGTKKTSNDVAKYIVKVKLSEVYVPKEEPAEAP